MCSRGRLEAGFGHNQPGTVLGLSTGCSTAVIPSSEEAVFSNGSPGFCLPAVLASEGGWGLVPVGGWTRTPGRAGEDAGTPDGLETPLGPTAAVPALCEALESSCCQLGGGQPAIPALSWLGRSSVTRAVLAVRIRPQQAEGGRGARCCGKRAWKPSKRADTIR